MDHGRANAVKKGWTVAEEHVYSDDGIFGAEFLKRPGFLRLVNALKPRPVAGSEPVSGLSRPGHGNGLGHLRSHLRRAIFLWKSAAQD